VGLSERLATEGKSSVSDQCAWHRIDGHGDEVPCEKPKDWHHWGSEGRNNDLSPDWTHHAYIAPGTAMARIDVECIQTFDGKHHFQPRRRLMRDSNGKTMDPNVKGHWYTVLSCACSYVTDDEEKVLAQLAETNVEKRRQREAASKLIKHDERQKKLL